MMNDRTLAGVARITLDGDREVTKEDGSVDVYKNGKLEYTRLSRKSGQNPNVHRILIIAVVILVISSSLFPILIQVGYDTRVRIQGDLGS